MAAFVTETTVIHGGSRDASSDVDQLGILANLQGLISVTTDVMTLVDDVASHIWLEGPLHTRLLVWRIHTATLVVQVRKAIKDEVVQTAIDNSITMLKRG